MSHLKNLFIIDGASGTGKSDLVHYVKENNIAVSIAKKYTTRPQRDYEQEQDVPLDLVFVDETEFQERGLDYKYKYNDYEYGFSRDEIDYCFEQSNNVFVIVRDVGTIRKLVKDYSSIVGNVVPVYVYSNRDEIKGRLIQQDSDKKRVALRLKRIEKTFTDYLEHSDIYQEILINNSDVDDYRNLIQRMLDKYKPSLNYSDKLVFVLPSSANADDDDGYFRAVEKVVTRYGLECKSADDIPGSFAIREAIKNNLRNCRLAVVDISGNKPTSYYNLGYIHGIANRCIITTHTSTSKEHLITLGYRVVEYTDPIELEKRLTQELQKELDLKVPRLADDGNLSVNLLEPRPIKILFLAANPSDTTRLKLDKEMHDIEQALRQTEFRDNYVVVLKPAVSLTELQGLLLRYKPDIVHFSGHGSSSSEIMLEGTGGQGQFVPKQALSRLFELLKINIRCVVLNACYSEQQANAIAEHIDCVIGMSKAIYDTASISFSAAFYQALGYGEDIKKAFELGCLQIDMEQLAQSDIPRLLARKCEPQKVKFILKKDAK